MGGGHGGNWSGKRSGENGGGGGRSGNGDGGNGQRDYTGQDAPGTPQRLQRSSGGPKGTRAATGDPRDKEEVHKRHQGAPPGQGGEKGQGERGRGGRTNGHGMTERHGERRGREEEYAWRRDDDAEHNNDVDVNLRSWTAKGGGETIKQKTPGPIESEQCIANT